MQLHKHKCGMSLGGYERGCGHVWEHDESCRSNREKHICPKCGRGPWYVRYVGPDVVLEEFSDFARFASRLPYVAAGLGIVAAVVIAWVWWR